jgi:lipoprotein-anchoring transpeptidase ErfK/SrfK/peptidoglycan hydrolase-like protein with peptidoglycan-binding domain
MTNQVTRRRRLLKGPSHRLGTDASGTAVGSVAHRPVHAEILRNGPTIWNVWRKKNPTTVPDLAGIALNPSERQMGPSNGEPINLKSAHLQDAFLRFAILSAADLEAADMSGADLAHAQLNQANLSAANLGNAQLNYVDLCGANLTKVNLHGATLRFATLSGADFEAADMSGADLVHARLNHANLRDANLSNAQLDYVDLGGANLTKVNLCGASLHHAKNLTREQLEETIGNASTTLPSHLQGAASWSRARGETGISALGPRGPMPRPRLTTNQGVPDKVFCKQLVGLVGGLVIGLFIAIGFVWKPINKTTPLAKLVPQRGTELTLPRPVLDPVHRDEQPSASQGQIDERRAAGSLSTEAQENSEQGRELNIKVALEPPSLLSAEPVAPSLLISATPAASLQVIVRALDLLAEVSVLSTPLPGLRQRTEALEASTVSPGSTSRATTAPDLLAEASPLLTPALAVSAKLLAPSLPEPSALRDILPLPIVAAPTRLALAVAVPPTEFKRSRDAPADNSTSPSREPLMLIVSVSDQNMDVYQASTRITSSKVSSGRPGYATKAGVFSILEKQRYHHSNLYDDAPMPWMQRLTRSGTALHAGVVPGYPASHGCIRLPFSFAPKLFQITRVGDIVVVARDRLSPKLIEHPNLFQPLPPQPTAEETQASQRQLSDAPDVSTESAGWRVMLANREGGAEIDGFGDHSATDGSHAVVASTPTTPLHILVTRQTQRDRIIGVQYVLSSLGYLTLQNFTGKLGTATADAIEAFEKANGMPETGLFTDDLAKKVYAVAGKEEPPEGHLFVRQDFNRVFDAPVAFRNPKQSLGTHVFTATEFAPGDNRIKWLALSLEGGDSVSVLDRIKIPDDVRQKISRRLTPGSSLIIADTSVDSAILPEGDDFLVWAEDMPTNAEEPEAKQANAEKAEAKKARVKHPQTKPAKPQIAQKGWTERSWDSAARRYSYDRPRLFGRHWLFSRW